MARDYAADMASQLFRAPDPSDDLMRRINNQLGARQIHQQNLDTAAQVAGQFGEGLGQMARLQQGREEMRLREAEMARRMAEDLRRQSIEDERMRWAREDRPLDRAAEEARARNAAIQMDMQRQQVEMQRAEMAQRAAERAAHSEAAKASAAKAAAAVATAINPVTHEDPQAQMSMVEPRALTPQETAAKVVEQAGGDPDALSAAQKVLATRTDDARMQAANAMQDRTAEIRALQKEADDNIKQQQFLLKQKIDAIKAGARRGGLSKEQVAQIESLNSAYAKVVAATQASLEADIAQLSGVPRETP